MKRALPQLPTISDVARRAGVSTATVSRVVNQPDNVREVVRAKVEAAIGQFGYVPNGGARSRKLRRTGNIGAIFPTVDNELRRFVKDNLASYKYPREVEFVDDFPLTSTGKISRKELRNRPA